MKHLRDYIFLTLLGCLIMHSNCENTQEISQIATDRAPKAIGPYSQAVRAGDYLLISGQLSIDPTTGTLIGANAEEQTRQVLKNIEAILHAAGVTFEHVVKTEVYLKNLDDFQAMNTVYAQTFSTLSNRHVKQCKLQNCHLTR